MKRVVAIVYVQATGQHDFGSGKVAVRAECVRQGVVVCIGQGAAVGGFEKFVYYFDFVGHIQIEILGEGGGIFGMHKKEIPQCLAYDCFVIIQFIVYGTEAFYNIEFIRIGCGKALKRLYKVAQ